MKKVILMVMLVAGMVNVVTSCKKDEKKSEKERVVELLLSGRWYYQSINTNLCFDASDYWAFKNDGTYVETWDFGDDTYVLSEDGKSFTFGIQDRRYTATIVTLTKSSLVFHVAVEGGATFTLAKTVAPGCPD